MKYGKHFNSKWASKILYNTYEIDIITIGHKSKKRVTAVTRNRQKKLAQNAKSLKFALPCRTNDIYIVYFSQKCPFDTKCSQFWWFTHFCRENLSLHFLHFCRKILDWKADSAKFFAYGMYAIGISLALALTISIDFFNQAKPNPTIPIHLIFGIPSKRQSKCLV